MEVHPENCVYLVTSSPPGRLLYLDSHKHSFREFPPIPAPAAGDDVLPVRDVSAHRQSLWALTEAGRVFLYVFGSATNIRIQVHTYENQRFRPLYKGWTDQLMMLDRPSWSSRDGLERLPKDAFQLPNQHNWEWEADWYVDDNMDGQPTERGGWLYAGNFTAPSFGPSGLTTVVRRRRWIRYMLYAATDKWAPIPQITTDSDEAFSHVAILSVGGSKMQGVPKGYLSVWAYTYDEELFFREGVSLLYPEGHSWKRIESKENITKMSCSPNGDLWVVNWQGELMIRRGICSETPWGTHWDVLRSSKSAFRFFSVSVGENCAWAISTEWKVKFLPNVQSKLTQMNWVDIMGEMFGVFMGLNNQVWAISLNNRSQVMFRDRVTTQELSGRGWKMLQVEQSGSFVQASGDDDDTCESIYKISLISSTSFDWRVHGEVPLNWFRKQVSFRLGRDQISDLLNRLKLRNEKEVRPFVERKEFKPAESSTVDEHVNNKIVSVSFPDRKGKSALQACVLSLLKEPSRPHVSSLSFQMKKGEPLTLPLTDISIIYHHWISENPTAALIALGIDKKEKYSSLLVVFQTGSELVRWINDVNVAIAESRGPLTEDQTNHPLLVINASGAVYCSYPELTKDDVHRKAFQPIKGHFIRIESHQSGVTWALSSENRLWYYKESSLGEDICRNFEECQTDSLTVEVEQIERWSLMRGFRPETTRCYQKAFWKGPSEQFSAEFNLDSVRLPVTGEWEWAGDWFVDMSNSDDDGWSYGPSAYSNFCNRTPQSGDKFRCKTHCRVAAFREKSNWAKVPVSSQMRIVDLSFELGCWNRRNSLCNNDRPAETRVWVLDEDGQLFFRDGVSSSCPEGVSWSHLKCDQPLVSISLGDFGSFPHLFGACRDGSTMLCYNLHSSPYWIVIQSPPGVKFTQIAAGKCVLVALDSKDGLWKRENATNFFPEGTGWARLCGDVQQVSVDLSGDIWAVMSDQGKDAGTLCRVRTQDSVDSSFWGSYYSPQIEAGISCDLLFVSARAFSQPIRRDDGS